MTRQVVVIGFCSLMLGVLGCDPPRHWETYKTAADLELEKGRLDMAEHLLLAALDEFEEADLLALKDTHIVLAKSFNSLAFKYQFDCQAQKAEANFIRALKILEQGGKGDKPIAATIRGNLDSLRKNPPERKQRSSKQADLFPSCFPGIAGEKVER